MSAPDHITFLANQLLPQFIPKDALQTTLSFQFTMVPNTTYKVNYIKNGKDWIFVNYEKLEV